MLDFEERVRQALDALPPELARRLTQPLLPAAR